MEKMGHKMGNGGGIEVSTPDKDKMMYPSIHLSHNIPSDLKDKDIGDMCRLEIRGKVVSKSESDTGEDMTIEIHEMGYMGDGKVDKDKYEKMSSEEKDKADEEEVMEEDE